MKPATLLKLILQATGVVCLFAIGAIFLPTPWMADIHAKLGLGVFPRAPIVEYLTRSIAAVYALLGALFVLIGSDLRQYDKVIRFMGGAFAIFGLALLSIDLYAGMPADWTWPEGLMTTGLGLAILFLRRAANRQFASKA
jgi:hypothetical protein